MFPSAPTSKSAEGTVKDRPSVREALRQIQARRQRQDPDTPFREGPIMPVTAAAPRTTVHQQPKHLKKSVKYKER